jgi:type II secretory pathway component PulC
MEAIYEADATAEKANVVLRGVLVGSPSIAFVSVSGKEQVLHINDVLPGGFRVEAITEHGIVLFYSKDETLNKTLNIGL